MKRYLIIVAVLLGAFAFEANGQKVAIKSNLLNWATATPNVGIEVALGKRWTMEVAGSYNPWTLDQATNHKAKHWLVTPEVRYWLCESLHGHFLGINGNYTQYNISGIPIQKAFINLKTNAPKNENLKSARAEGWAVGAGITYGYQFIIAPRWNLELTAGIGWWYAKYDRFESRKCGLFEQSVYKHAIGPTSLGVSFIYVIK